MSVVRRKLAMLPIPRLQFCIATSRALTEALTTSFRPIQQVDVAATL
jgi:hypothetical protein